MNVKCYIHHLAAVTQKQSPQQPEYVSQDEPL